MLTVAGWSFILCWIFCLLLFVGLPISVSCITQYDMEEPSIAEKYCVCCPWLQNWFYQLRKKTEANFYKTRTSFLINKKIN